MSAHSNIGGKAVIARGRGRASCGLMYLSKAPTLFDHPVQAAEGMDRTIAGDGTCYNWVQCRNVFPPSANSRTGRKPAKRVTP
jgi:hypothetical protein